MTQTGRHKVNKTEFTGIPIWGSKSYPVYAKLSSFKSCELHFSSGCHFRPSKTRRRPVRNIQDREVQSFQHTSVLGQMKHDSGREISISPVWPGGGHATATIAGSRI
jgi:hypothetical protein